MADITNHCHSYFRWSVAITLSLFLILSPHFMPYQRVLSVNSCFAETNSFALHVITYYSMPLATAFTCSILLCCHKDLLDGCLSLSSIPSMLPAVKRANVYYALPLLALTLGVVRYVELLPAPCIYKQSCIPLSLPFLSPRC